MTNRTLNRENALRLLPYLAFMDIEDGEFQLPSRTPGISPWLGEVGVPCYFSLSGLHDAILGYGMVLSPLGSDEILDCPLDHL